MREVRLTTKGILLVSVFMILFSFGLGFGIWKVTGLPNLSPTDSNAGGCKGYDSKDECEDHCSPNKGNKNKSYVCKWINGECKDDGNQVCSFDGSRVQDPCYGKTVPDNQGKPEACLPGVASVCQQNENGKNTGYECKCVRLSQYQCSGVWNCSTLNLNKCKPDPNEGQAPIKAGCIDGTINGIKNLNICGCGLVGNCLVIYNFEGNNLVPVSVKYNKYTCLNSSLNDEGIVKSGCQTAPETGFGSRICASLPPGQCGWVQVDTYGGCFASWYFPCDDESGGNTPPPITNKCDGGGLIGSSTESGNVGDPGVFRGYANDVDGLGTVTILRNNSVVGTATTVDACSLTSDTRAIELCNQFGSGKVVVWTYNYVVEEGTAVYKAVWKDAKGIGGILCETTKTVSGTTVVEENDWNMSKNAGFVCMNRDTQSAQVRIDYTISVTNSASTARNITRVVDTLDNDINPAWIQVSTINPSATVDGRVITWNITGDLAVFAPGQTKLFRYSVLLPIGVGGTYDNTAVITPEVGDDITVETTIFASCDIPDTAIFDSTISRVVLGAILLLLGLAYLYYEPFTRYANLGLSYVFPTHGDMIERNRNKFERKVVKK